MDEDEIFGKVISVYSLDQAIKDGVLVEVFKNRWQELSQGKPIVATAHLFNAVSLAALLRNLERVCLTGKRTSAQRCLKKISCFLPR